jgi:hypothetical protein
MLQKALSERIRIGNANLGSPIECVIAISAAYRFLKGRIDFGHNMAVSRSLSKEGHAVC